MANNYFICDIRTKEFFPFCYKIAKNLSNETAFLLSSNGEWQNEALAFSKEGNFFIVGFKDLRCLILCENSFRTECDKYNELVNKYKPLIILAPDTDGLSISNEKCTIADIDYNIIKVEGFKDEDIKEKNLLGLLKLLIRHETQYCISSDWNIKNCFENGDYYIGMTVDEAVDFINMGILPFHNNEQDSSIKIVKDKSILSLNEIFIRIANADVDKFILRTLNSDEYLRNISYTNKIQIDNNIGEEGIYLIKNINTNTIIIPIEQFKYVDCKIIERADTIIRPTEEKKGAVV